MKKLFPLLLALTGITNAYAVDPPCSVTVSANSYCLGQSLTLTASLHRFSDVGHYEWQYLSAPSTWITIANSDNSQYVVRAADFTANARTYRVVVQRLTGALVYSDAICITKCCLVPVRIESFNGYVRNGTAYFTLKVSDAATTTLEYSYDGHSFHTLALVNGTTCSDDDIVGEKYYRLKAVSSDGNTVYSPIITLRNKIDFNQPYTYMVLLFDGRAVQKGEQRGTSSTEHDAISDAIEHLQSGHYLISIKQRGTTVSYSVLK